MKQTIAIISRKGGTGKTTTAQSIAAVLRGDGFRVLLIDLDSQRNLSESMDAKPTGPNVTHLLEGAGDPDGTIQHTRNGDIITGSPFLAGADLAIQRDTELKEALEPLKKEYDYIIIDTPGSYGKLTRNALAASTSAIITAQAATFSIQGLAELADIVQQIKGINPKLKLRGVVITNYVGRSKKAAELLDEMKKAARKLKTQVLEPPIKSTVKVIEAQAERTNLIDYAPRSTAAQCYIELTETVKKW